MNRRRFIEKTWAGMGLSLAMGNITLAGKPTSEYRGKKPLIVASRGLKWGEKVCRPAWETLNRTGSLLDAVERGANVVELDPEDTSVGYGGLPNENGEVELDASIMYGPTGDAGSVGALKFIKTPSSVARKVMERSDHIMLVGEGALKFALAHGFKKENLLTEKSREIWLKWKETNSDRDDWLPPKKIESIRPHHGTINVLGLDRQDNLAGITTTSGLSFKIPGRVGDSPIIGAGLYAAGGIGAAGATGRGEEVIKVCGSFLVVEFMRQGMTPQEACETACRRIIEMHGGKVDFSDKFVAVNSEGQVGCAAVRGRKGTYPEACFYDADGFHLVKGRYLIEY